MSVGASPDGTSEPRGATLQEAPLRIGADELERSPIGTTGLLGAAQPAQQVGAGGMEIVVAVEIEPLDRAQPRLGSPRLGNRHSAIAGADGRPADRPPLPPAPPHQLPV